MLEEENAGKLSVVALPVAGAMKLLVRSEIGASISSICPLKGLTARSSTLGGNNVPMLQRSFYGWLGTIFLTWT